MSGVMKPEEVQALLEEKFPTPPGSQWLMDSGGAWIVVPIQSYLRGEVQKSIDRVLSYAQHWETCVGKSADGCTCGLVELVGRVSAFRFNGKVLP